MPLVIPVRLHFNSDDLLFDPAQTGAVEGDFVVVPTDRGTEFGLVTADPYEVSDSQVDKVRPVTRVATASDIDQADGLARKGEQTMPLFRRLVEKHKLDIKPAGVEFLFGGEKVAFYFAAEERVDFRDLVRELATSLHARIDMRQIGVRDEARLRGGYATCGQELCCTRLGGKFEPVSIRMAKEQDLPLNSAKISGVCGRLMCCLRYEFEAYKDFKQRAPKRNALIDTPLGKAKVVDMDTPRERLTLRLENGRSFVVPLSDMTCSEGCCKRNKDTGGPLRPDTVTREVLESVGTAEIIAQLADMDRANDPDADAYALDSSLVTPHRRDHDAISGASRTPASHKREPRRHISGTAQEPVRAQATTPETQEHTAARRSQGQDRDQQVAPLSEIPTTRRTRRRAHGGTVPTGSAIGKQAPATRRPGAEDVRANQDDRAGQDTRATQDAHTTQDARPTRRRGMQPRRTQGRPTPETASSASPARHDERAERRGENTPSTPQRRTRRRTPGSTARDNAAPTRQNAPASKMTPDASASRTPADSAATPSRQPRRRTRNQTAPATRPTSGQGGSARQDGGATRTHRSVRDAASTNDRKGARQSRPAPSPKPAARPSNRTGQLPENNGPTRRHHRRPGDKGGQGAGGSQGAGGRGTGGGQSSTRN